MVIATAYPEIETASGPATTRRIVLVVEYDGTNYHGFQLQSEQPTLQKELEKALYELTGEKIRVAAASRTDSGVHAEGQVISFKTGSKHSIETFISGMNYYLPENIVVKTAYRVQDSYSVRRKAVSREYNYYILNRKTRSPLRERFCYHVPGHLDIESMNRASKRLIGIHDFVSFVNNREAAEKSTVRRVYRAETKREGDLVTFNMVANSFIMHQVRNTIGTLIRVGQGKMSPEDFSDMLRAEKPGLAWPTAPANGLFLTKINYQNPFGDE